MTNYVVGFITDGKRVLLIKKNRPSNQYGLYNGVGGKIQDGETPLAAMIREAKEETNLDIQEWIKIDTLDYPNVTLTLFQATVSKKFITNYKTTTDEIVRLFKINNLPQNLVNDVSYICHKRLIKPNKQKELFNISYLDELGNGLNNYYIGTEQQVKKIVKDLFEEQKLKACNDYEHMYADDTEPYFFDQDTYTGYVIKNVGFVLRHYIKWNKISSNIKKIPKYELVEHAYMCSDNISKFSTLKNGLKKLKKVSLESSKGYQLSDENVDGEPVRQGKIRKDKNGFYSCNYYYWTKVSYEHDEWDITSTNYLLVPCKVIVL